MPKIVTIVTKIVILRATIKNGLYTPFFMFFSRHFYLVLNYSVVSWEDLAAFFGALGVLGALGAASAGFAFTGVT